MREMRYERVSTIWSAEAFQRGYRSGLKDSTRWPVADESTPELVLELLSEQTYKTKVYTALRHAIAHMDIYSSPDPT